MLARKHEQGAVATLNPCASLVYSLKFDASSDALVRPEPASHDPSQPPGRTSAGPCDWFLLAADRQAFTPFCPPPLQYKPAVFCTHSHQKPMSSLSAASIGLKRSLSLHCESFCINNKPSMVANAFLRCQLARLCVRVGGFRESSPRRSKACAFGCSPKFSTPVEKTVEIRQVWGRSVVLPRFFGALPWGETARTRYKRLRRRSSNGRGRKMAPKDGAKVQQPHFFQRNEPLG
jgi:hypothetical protein